MFTTQTSRHWMLAAIGLFMVLTLGAWAGPTPGKDAAAPGPVRVEIRKNDQRFELLRAGRPYLIKGAVTYGDPLGKFPLRDLAARGANSIRVGMSRGDMHGMLDEAWRQGLSVTVGLPMKQESVSKFDYDNPAAVRQQFEQIKRIVMQLKDHPAVLLWGIGNELGVDYKNLKVWDAVNDVARMIHELDPNHPAMTVLGGESINPKDLEEIRRRCPDLDLLGVNYYKGVETVPARLREGGWDRPYVITEWGPSGHWQVKRTKWGAEIEETSTEKAVRYLERYQNTMLKDRDRCLGSYAFLWQSRQERTHTWYGMFLESGERTDAVNVMQYLWSGRWPANRAPRIDSLLIDGKAAGESVYVQPGARCTARVQVADPDSDALTLRWEISPEVPKGGYAGMGERRATPLPDLIRAVRNDEITFAAPQKEGAYRVFVYVLDGQGNAATANIPFFAKKQ